MMELAIAILLLMLLAGGMFALSGRITGRTRFEDKDADGEPDEPNGPAKDL